MFETMHYDIHLEKERGMFKAAETARQVRLLKAGRRKMRFGSLIFSALWLDMQGKVKQLRHAVDSVVLPNHHGLSTGK